MEIQDHNYAKSVNYSNNPAMVRDKYCYYCDRKCYKCHCSTCFRSFHVDCLKQRCGNSPMKHDADPFICPVCIGLEAAKVDFVGKESLLGVLKYPINAIMGVPNFQNLKHLQSEGIANPIDLNVIKQKVDSMTYESLEAFQVDIDCIYHNVRTLVNKSSACESMALSGTASKLVKLCESEIDHMQSCAKCYEMKYTRPKEWHTLACSKPHLLLWVNWGDRKIKKWPAKLLSHEGDTAKVIFFGYTFLYEVPTSDCFIYSTKAQLRLQRQAREPKDRLEDALKQVELYKQNIQHKFGSFNDKLNNIPFYPYRYNRHMRDMFPEYVSGSPHDRNESTSSDFDDIDFDDSNNSSFGESEEGTSDYTNGTSETSESVSTGGSNENEIPKKRQRLSLKIESDSDKTSESGSSNNCNDNDVPKDRLLDTVADDSQSPTSTRKDPLSPDSDPISSSSVIIPTQVFNTSSSDGIQSNPNPKCEPSEGEVTIQEELQTIKLLEDMVMKRENLNQTKVQDLRHELEKSKNLNSNWQAKYAAFESQMQHTLAENEKLRLDHSKMAQEVSKLQEEKNRLHDELQTIRNKAIELEKSHNRTLAERPIYIELRQAKAKILQLEIDKGIMRKRLADTQIAMERLQENLEANHMREMNELGDQHKRELEFENKRAADEMEKMIMEHTQKVRELENQIKNINEKKAKDEEQLKQSFDQIVNNLTQKTEAKKCEGCGQFKTELFCGSLCEGAWTSFRNSLFSDQNTKQE